MNTVHSIAVAAVRTHSLRVLKVDGELEALRMFTDRRETLTRRRVQTENFESPVPKRGLIIRTLFWLSVVARPNLAALREAPRSRQRSPCAR